MKLHTLKPAEGSIKNSKRIGRGPGSGRGGTSTRGHKGAKSRSGYSRKLGFEGGQMPLQRRVPKFGFKNPNRVEYKAVNLEALEALASKLNIADITVQVLIENGIVGKNDLVKVLGRGELTTKINVSSHKCSVTASQAIEKLGGTVTIISE
jgi:large subunit ribosomal protein L15